MRRRRNRGRSRRLAAALALLVVAGSVQADEPATPDAFLEMGLRQVDEGDFEAAVFSLDTAVRRLPLDATSRRVQAYVSLGAAYVGMGQAETAKGKFREALALDPGLRLDPQRFAPNVLKVFETQALKTTAARNKRSGRVAVIAGGAGAAGAIAVAALTRRDEPIPNAVPTASLDVSPSGFAVVGVTLMTFRASGADPDGDPLSFRWTFSDGESATGETVTHRYVTEGTFTVTLTAEDGRGGAATATATVTARGLSGRWRAGTLRYDLEQNGPVLSGLLVDGATVNLVSGTIGDSRTVAWTAEHAASGRTHYVFSGVADERLETLTGTHEDVSGFFVGPVTLVRQ